MGERRLKIMSKKINGKTKKDQEILRWVYDPIADDVILYNIYPLFQKGKKLEGRDWAIAEELLKLFVYDICDSLDIPVPNVKYSSSGFPSETTVAKYNMYDNTIYINKRFERIFGDLVFGFAGALRIAWQEKRHSSLVSKLKHRAKISLEEFDFPEPIIDATAYACVAIELCFEIEVEPSFSGSMLDAVIERKEFIYQEMLLEE